MRNIKKKLLSLGLTAAMIACYTPATILLMRLETGKI